MTAFTHASIIGQISKGAGSIVDTGWVSPGTVESIQDGASFRTWASPGNATSSDNADANQGPLDAASNDFLQATNFDFSAIPGTATILGIEARIERQGQEFVGASRIFDDTIQLVKAGTRQGNNKSTGAGWAFSAEEIVTFGGAADLWGLTFTAAEVKASNFGFTMRCSSSPTNGSADVDHMQMRITYQT